MVLSGVGWMVPFIYHLSCLHPVLGFIKDFSLKEKSPFTTNSVNTYANNVTGKNHEPIKISQISQ